MLFALVITSCAIKKSDQSWDPLSQDSKQTETGIHRSKPGLSPAISSLIKQADQSIEKQQWSKAISILERALRINTKQAETWTRMAVVYLGQNNPEQALHMAKRSNTYANHDKGLQSYNWLLISRAYRQLNQFDKAIDAENKSNRLK